MQLLATQLPYKATPASELFAKKDQILDPDLVDNFWSFYKRKADHSGSGARPSKRAFEPSVGQRRERTVA